MARPHPPGFLDIANMEHAMPNRIAYMPLNTYPEAIADQSIHAAMGFAATLGCSLHVSTFSVDIPQLYSPMGGMLLDVPGLVQGAEERSKAECRRLENLVQGAAGPGLAVHCSNRNVVLGAALDLAAGEARYFDLALLPWTGDNISAQDLSEAVVFGSGRPAILVPPSAPAARIDRIAVAWDGSRFAARALNDALPYLAGGGRISVLTVKDEKPLSRSDLSGALAFFLGRRGYDAKALDVSLNKKSIGAALQDAALSEGAKLLAMGGFGHSRLRDFVLGGATKDILRNLQLPIMLSH
jgi:nucleotide-binding universal stress UspA family protein